MIASAHVLAGLICGVAVLSTRSVTSRVVIAFGLGVASHVILDAIPHSDYGGLSRSTIVAVVTSEVIATLLLAWFLLRRRKIPGWRSGLAAGVVGASIPDVKFLAPFLREPVATWIEVAANRFHGPFHAWPAPLVVEVSVELVCTLALGGALIIVVRFQDAQRSREIIRDDPRGDLTRDRAS